MDDYKATALQKSKNKIIELLQNEPRGLSIPQITSMSKVSAKTAKNILSTIDVDHKDGVYFSKNPKQKDIKMMIDLESMGTKPNSAILSIGAVIFDNNGIHGEFYVNIDLENSMKLGFDVDPSTIYWWLKQSSAAGSVLSKNLTSANEAIKDFCNFVHTHEAGEVWANSDCVMLKSYFDKLGYDAPWKFWIERDFRTFLSLTDAERVEPTEAHNALDDAKAQAQTLINYWKQA